MGFQQTGHRPYEQRIIANAFGGTFAFLQPHNANQKSKRATKPTHQANSKMD